MDSIEHLTAGRVRRRGERGRGAALVTKSATQCTVVYVTIC